MNMRQLVSCEKKVPSYTKKETHFQRNKTLTHETSRVVRISSDLSIYSNVSVKADHLSLMTSESVVQSVSQHNNQRKTLTKLVRSSGRTGGPDTSQFVKHPMLGCIQTLQMFLRSASLYNICELEHVNKEESRKSLEFYLPRPNPQ
jgi:hypothetical protein